jgi:ATP-dependent Lhr-like helicase
LPKWRRPEHAEAGTGVWSGRWAVIHSIGTLGIEQEEQISAANIAQAWLARYGIVSRDWWSRERPAIGWRDIYHELKRLEFRGDVQRGYFVAGLAGAQFALQEAVEMLRAQGEDAENAVVVMPTSDPSNVYSLPLAPNTAADPIARPRGAAAHLVTIGGRIILASEGRGARIRIASEASSDEVRAAATAIGERLVRRYGTARRRDIIVETIDGERAAGSSWADSFREAGFKSAGSGLRFYGKI